MPRPPSLGNSLKAGQFPALWVFFALSVEYVYLLKAIYVNMDIQRA